jgi:dienelactone hydrolase
MARGLSMLSVVAMGVFLAAAARLGSIEGGQPRHTDMVLEGGIPATLYLPGPPSGWSGFRDPPAMGERPPAIVLAHGFSADRRAVSSPARRLAEAGYAVLAPDLRGHGQNRNPYTRNHARSDNYFRDLSAAVDFLRTSPHVDGSRIAVAGQSMGAGAALDYGTRDSGIDGVVLISGGWTMNGPYRAPNALFIYAERDPSSIRDRSRELASQLAGVSDVERSRTYGNFALGTAVRAVEVPGADHLTIIWSDFAIREIADWLDAIFRIDRPTGELPDDPRMRWIAILGLCLPFLMPGLGALVGRLVPTGEELSASGRATGLLVLAAALGLTMPLLAAGPPLEIVSLAVADELIGHLALAGVALLVLLALQTQWSPASQLRGVTAALIGAGVAMIGVFVLLSPLGLFLHRLTLTPERMLAFFLSTLSLFPFSLATALLLRRGPPLTAALYALAGRVLVVLALLVDVWTGLLSGVLVLLLGPLVLVFALAELLAASIYATSRNLVAIAAIDAAFLALILAAIMPIRI